jgi:5-methylcytosine-specific restriction endonuclease McrA
MQPPEERKALNRARMAAYRASNPELTRTRAAANRAAHPEKARASTRNYRLTHPYQPGRKRHRSDEYKARNAARARLYRKEHPEVIQAYRKSHPDQRFKWNPLKLKLARAVRSGRKRARAYGARIIDLTNAQWTEIVERHQWCICAYCKRESIVEMDHVIALSRGGNHTASNVVPACRACNFTKNWTIDRAPREALDAYDPLP